MSTTSDYAHLVTAARASLDMAIDHGDRGDAALAENGAEGLGVVGGVAFWRDNIGNLEVLAFSDGNARVESFGEIVYETERSE